MMCAIEVTPTLATERLLLRGVVHADAERIAELANDADVASMTIAMPHPYTREEAESWLARCRGMDWEREAHFVIEHHNFGMVGGLGFKPGPNGRPELGYWLGRAFWNRGYASQTIIRVRTGPWRAWLQRSSTSPV